MRRCWLGCCGVVLAVTSCASAPPPPLDVTLPIAPPTPAKPEPVAPAPAPSASSAPSAPTAPGPGIRVVQGGGVRYEVPATWDELDASTLGSPLIALAQRAPEPRGGFFQNVNVASEPFTGDGPAYGAANLTELAKVSRLRDQHATSVGDRAGWYIESDWPNPGATPYVTMQRYGTNGARGFVLTCSMAASVASELRASCDAILQSFRVE